MRHIKIKVLISMLICCMAFITIAYAQAIRFPENLTMIEEEAFANCQNFKGEVTLPEEVEIVGKHAFLNCTGITTVRIGEKVQIVGEQAFAGCNRLRQIWVYGMETQFNDDLFGENHGTIKFMVNKNSAAETYAINHNYSYEYIENQIDPSLIPPVGSVFYEGSDPRYVFISYGDGTVGLKSETTSSGKITIPAETQNGLKVTVIEDYAFNNGNYTGTLTIPEGITRIGNHAFYYCESLTGNLILPSTLQEIDEKAFTSCRGFSGNLVIPKSVVSIGELAFASCRGFTGNLVLNEGLTFIGKEAFDWCDGLTGSVQFPSTLQTISDRAFYHCDGLSGDLIFNKGLTYIGERAFYNCTGFDGQLYLPDGLTEIGDSVFANCAGITGPIRFPSSLKKISNRSFVSCESLTGDLVFPEGLEVIDELAFYLCKSLKGGTVSFPSTLKRVEDSAFSAGPSFSGTLTLPNGLEKFLGISGSFTGDLRIPGSVKEIGGMRNSSFTGSLILENGVEIIGESAFSGNHFSGDLHIPASVRTIEKLAFVNTKFDGEQLILENGIETIREKAFQFTNFTGNLHIPASIRTIEDYAFEGSGFNGTLTIDEGVESIGKYAFHLRNHPSSYIDERDRYGYLNGDLILPDSLKALGISAFEEAYYRPDNEEYDESKCGQLRLSPNCPIIPTSAFENCNKFKSIAGIPVGVKRIEDRAFTGLYINIPILVLPEGLIYLGSLPNYCAEIWLPSTLREINLKGINTYGVRFFVDTDAEVSDYLIAQGISCRLTSSSMKAPEGVLYQGDPFELGFTYMLLGKEYDSISAYILQNNEIIQSARYELIDSVYSAQEYINNKLKFDMLPLGEGYKFRLCATIGETTTVLVETTFRINEPPVRRWLRNLKTPDGIITRDEQVVTGNVECNYPITSIEVIVTASIGQTVRIRKTYNIPEENQLDIPMDIIIESTLLNQLNNGKYYLQITANVPSRNASFYIVKEKVFWLVTTDGQVDEATLEAVFQYATNISNNNIGVFSPYSNWLKALVETMDWTDILKMAYNGRWEIFDQYVFEGGSDSYMKKFCKAQILAVLDDVAHRQHDEFSNDYDSLQKKILGYISKGTKNVNDYANNEGLFVGGRTVTLSADDKKVFDSIKQIGDTAKKMKDTVQYWDDFDAGYHFLMSHLAADYTVQLAVLNSVLDAFSNSQTQTAAVHALQEIKAEFSDKFYGVVREFSDYLIQKGESYIRGIVLEKPLPLLAITDFISDKIMSITGWAEDAENDMNILAWDQNCTACIKAYRLAYERVQQGDTSAAAINGLLLTFKMTKECCMSALQESEDFALERYGTISDVRQLEAQLEKLKIPGVASYY